MQPISKALRFARLLLDFRLRRSQVGGAPIRLWIETASSCNLRCVMCPNKELAAGTKGLMSLALFRKIIDECRHFASDVYLHHRGEPLLNPALFDMIAYARSAGLRTRFHTNGTLLDKDKARRLLDAAPDLVSFSFDGFSKATYEHVRAGATFEHTLANIIHLATMRRERRLAKPYIVVEKINFKTGLPPPDAHETAHTAGELMKAGVDEIIEKEEYTWACESSPAAARPREGTACTFLWYAMVVCADGTVTPCPQDFNAHMRLGNAKTSSLLEIWNGGAYCDLRLRMARDLQSLSLCRKCDRLCRRTIGGVPLQYMATFLIDHLLGYGRIRKMLGTHERN